MNNNTRVRERMNEERVEKARERNQWTKNGRTAMAARDNTRKTTRQNKEEVKKMEEVRERRKRERNKKKWTNSNGRER